MSQEDLFMIQKIREKSPRIHAITNIVTANDCANLILAAGGSPTMASDLREAAEMTAQCQGLILNMGAVSQLDSMLEAGREAAAMGNPIVLDPVGAGATELRRKSCLKIVKELPVDVICGNASEIRSMAEGTKSLSGVDTLAADSISEANMQKHIEIAKKLNKRTGAIVAMSGVIDLVVQGERFELIRGGSSYSTRITGAGCMLTALIAVFLAAKVTDEFSAVIGAMSCMKRCSERAEIKTEASGGGTMVYRMHLIDEVSLEGGIS